MRGGIFERGGIYYTNVWSPLERKKVKERVGTDKTAALTRAAQLRIKFLAQRRRARGPIAMPRLSEYIPIALEQHWGRMRSKTNAARSLNYFLEFIGDVLLVDVSKGDLERYKYKRLQEKVPHPYKTGHVDPEKVEVWNAKAKNVEKTTINREVEAIKRLFNHAVENDILEHSPLATVKKYADRETRSRRRTRVLLDHEAPRFFDAMRVSRSEQLEDICSVALYSGRRRGDILNLKLSDYDRKNGQVQLRNTKDGSPQWIPLPPKAQQILDRIYDERCSEWFFPGRDGSGPLQDVDTAFNVAKKKAGLVDFRFHDLRRTAISCMVMAGIDMLTIARQVGHTSAAMLDKHYGHLTPKHKAASAVIFGAYMDKLTGMGPRPSALSSSPASGASGQKGPSGPPAAPSA